MSEENKENNEERERYVKELVTEYSRRELDEIAVGLGLDLGDYLNKRAVAEAILEAREREEVPIEEVPPEHPLVEEVRAIEEMTEEMGELSTDTVKGKIRAMEKKAAGFKSFALTLQENAQEWLQKSIAAFHQSVKEQVKENKDFARKIDAGIKAFHQSMKMFQQSIQEQVKENQNFVKRFYG